MNDKPAMTPEAKANATNRIKQLLRKNNEQSLQLAYMQLVTAQLMVLIPKNAVSNILDAAAKKIHNQTKGY